MSKTNALGLSAVLFLLGWAVGGSMKLEATYAAGVKEGQSATYKEARKDLENELRRVCKPWFTWKHQTIVACTAPDWMK